MTGKRYRVYLEDMVEAIHKIRKYLDQVEDSEAFINNDWVVDAVTRNYRDDRRGCE